MTGAMPGTRALDSGPKRRRGLPLERFGWHVLLLALVLLGIGMLLIRSMDQVGALYGNLDVSFEGHLLKVAVASPMLIAALFMKPSWLRRNAWTIYGIAIIALILVPIIGEERNNARRWIPTPIGFDLQPSEFAKIALIVALAKLLRRNRLRSFTDWLAPVAVALVPMLLVAAQPDLGTALTIVPITVGLFYMAGASGRVMGGLLLCGLAAGYSAYRFELVQDYQLRRIHTWVDTYPADELVRERNGPSFHVYMSRVSIGNGGLHGTGLGQGVATRAAHLPERESDSIFCVVAEEGGFYGVSAFVAIYVGLILLLLRLGAEIRDRFARFVVAGVGLYFAAHFFINAGVNLGLVPMTGLPLPLLSTGGSSLMATFAAVGLALGTAARHEPSLDREAFRD